MLAKPVRQLSEINSQIQKGLAAAEDIFSQIDEDTEKNEGEVKVEKIEGRISMKEVEFSYRETDLRTLKGINLEIDKGETVAFVGKSRSWKNNLDESIASDFMMIFHGKIERDDISLKDFEIKNLRSHIALVSQNITLFNDTIADNINYGSSDNSLDEIKEAAIKANAHEFIEASTGWL